MPQNNALQPHSALPELIVASWQRCRHYGLSPHLHIQQNVLPPSGLRLQQDQNHQLRRLALREMHLLENILSDTGRMMLLTDPAGLVLDSQGDNTFLGRARKVSLTPGASWREQVTGTNAIGTAIVERRFVQVLGGQHFFDENRFLACSAMPIISPNGDTAGVLDISGNAYESFSSAASLVRHAVAHIEHDWVAETAAGLLVHLHQHPSWLGTPDEGILAFHDGLLTGASSRALAFLGLSHAAVHAANWHDIFQQKPSLGPQQLHLISRSELFYAIIARAQAASAWIAATESAHAGPENLKDVKDKALRRAVAAENGNITAAARKLGIHRSTVYRRLSREDA